MNWGAEHVSGFSPNGKLFAFVNDQGILKIWNTGANELKQEYTTNLNLAGPCSALVWISVACASLDHKLNKPRKSANTKETFYIALGTSKGQISLYSYAEAKIESTFKGDGHAGKITSIVSDTQGRLFTCGEDCQVGIWSISEQKQLTSWSVGPEKPYSIKYMPMSNTLVVGSDIVKVYSVESQELVQTFNGHNSEIIFMESFVYNDKIEYALTTSRLERIICLFKIGKKGRNKAPSCSLLMEDIAYCVSCQLEDETKLRVCSVTRSGVIHLYVIDLESIKADKPIKPKLTISIASESATVIEPIPAIASSLQYGNKKGELLFGYGDKDFMAFEHLKLNFNEKLQVLMRKDPKELIKEKLNKSDKRTTDVTVSKKQINSLDMPMESRLQDLNLNAPSSELVPQSQSKVQLLVQSLHKKDANLLRSVLCTNDMKTIQLTLEKLPVQYVAALVNELTLLMQKKHANVQFATIWLKVLSQTHASHFMDLGKDDLLNMFGPIIGILQDRVNLKKQLAIISPQLNLTVSQIRRKHEESNLKTDNVLVYEDNDSDSDLDDTVHKTLSDDEWEEGDEDNDGLSNDEQENGDDIMEVEEDDEHENMEM